MKRVTYIGKDGVAKCVLLRDEDSENNPELGIPVEPPPIERIVRESALDVQNEFVLRGILTYRDFVQTGNGVTSVLQDVLRKRIIEAFKLKESEENGNEQL